ncbi:shikimate/quinate 5-dehydrogenase [Aureobasidium pullulans]|uniref:Shikimate/quinate 5-dehydrogenase n=1 Tax=Aureobasidium pullulans TaxID=5580 RepID=A0A4S9XJ89_AURPU|nr:shikimate/quinate 5-dehydrogenase [Aureobasidium pullulans]
MAAPQRVISCETPAHDHVERCGYLFGWPINHSMSPLMHKTIFGEIEYNWEQFFLPSTDMSMFLSLVREVKFFGASVTMPHKVAIMKHVDELTQEGREVGAVNTLYLRKNGDKTILVGTNTDVIGIREAFYQNISNPDEVFHGRPGMVIGGGGAARSAVYALKKFMKCSKVYIVNRDKAEVDAVVSWCSEQGYGDGVMHAATVEQAQELEGPGAIVSCVPDFPPVTEAEQTARKVMEVFLAKPHKGAILEMCYHPNPWTQIAEISQNAGWNVILGTEAMIYQGLEQSMYWTGKTLDQLPVAKVKEVIAAQLKSGH